MPGGGRRWKTLVSRYVSPKLDIEFSTAAPLPWKSQTARFPHFHSAGHGLTYSISIEKTKPGRCPSGSGWGIHERRFLSFLVALRFRIILYWNQMSISVSSFDWKMLGAYDIA